MAGGYSQGIAPAGSGKSTLLTDPRTLEELYSTLGINQSCESLPPLQTTIPVCLDPSEVSTYIAYQRLIEFYDDPSTKIVLLAGRDEFALRHGCGSPTQTTTNPDIPQSNLAAGALTLCAKVVISAGEAIYNSVQSTF